MTAELRELHFENVDQTLNEIERLASGEVKTTGNYSFGQIVEHLARTMDVVSGKTQAPPVALPMRLMARIMRPFILSRPMKPGFKLPSSAQSFFWPTEDVPADQAVNHFREALDRYKATEPLPKHPFFGQMTREQNDLLQRGHCAMHLGFVHPVA